MNLLPVRVPDMSAWQNMDRHTSPSRGSPAPYGHACASCAQSKCKCIIRRAGEPCERCRRLNKDCRPAEKVRHRSPRKPAVSKTARLEEKLDGLVSLIKAGAQSGQVTTSLATAVAMDDFTLNGNPRINANTSTQSQSERDLIPSSSNDYIHNVPVLTPATEYSTGSSYILPPSGFRDPGGEPSSVEAEEYLINFRTYKLKYFPFIHIPSTTTAQQLRQERPFLWLCIMAVGSKSKSQQQVLGSNIRQKIAQELVVQSERNIDLLLGILAFIGWAHCHLHPKPFLSVFTQLMASLVFDLGLNKPVSKVVQMVPCIKDFSKYLRLPTSRTNEERRAVLGCFLVTSIISSFLQKIDALRWTPHMDECLQVLDDRKECPNDEILIQQVRLQLIVEKMALETCHDAAMESPEHAREPQSLYLEAVHAQLLDIKTKLLAQPQIDEAILLHLYSAEIDTALPPRFLHTNQLTFQQRKSLQPGLESIKSWFDIFLAISPAAYIGFPFAIFSQLVRCITTLCRLTTLDVPGWDQNGVCKTADPFLTLERVINNLEQRAIVAGIDNSDSLEKDVFSRAAQMFRSLRPGWESKRDLDNLSTIPTQQDANVAFAPDPFAVEFFDDWLTDLLLPLEY